MYNHGLVCIKTIVAAAGARSVGQRDIFLHLVNTFVSVPVPQLRSRLAQRAVVVAHFVQPAAVHLPRLVPVQSAVASLSAAV